MKTLSLGLLTLILVLSGCGGGTAERHGVSAAARVMLAKSGIGQPRRALAAATPAESAASPYGEAIAEDAVEQLLDFAEAGYRQHFPTHQPTGVWQQFRYRYYASTGAYVGVAVGVGAGDGLVEGGVYVMGGEFGATPVFVGELTRFITPRPTQRTGNSGLIPVPGPVGAILYADAGALRPLRPGSVWSYGGVLKRFNGDTPTNYLTSTTLEAATNGVIEQASNAANEGVASQPVALVNGSIVTTQPIDFLDNGRPEMVMFTELRSPVRQGEQIVSVDRRISDSGIDVDGDHLPDPLDVVIYNRVVGTETLNLPNLPSLATVRVDTFVLTRVCASSTGECSPIVQGTQKTWYAAGIGIVRTASETPNPSGSDVSVSDEQIVYSDGIDTGFGLMPQRDLRVPWEDGSERNLMSGLADNNAKLFAFPTHALLLSLDPSNPVGVAGLVVTKLGRDGTVLSYKRLVGVYTDVRNCLKHESGITCIGTAGSDQALLTLRLDAEGAMLDRSASADIDLSGGLIVAQTRRFAAAADGDTLWTLWERTGRRSPSLDFVNEVVLRAYDVSGHPKTAEIIVDGKLREIFGGVTLALTARNNTALLAWTPDRGSEPTNVYYANATTESVSIEAKVLATGLSSSHPAFIFPVLYDPGGALYWSTRLGTGGLLPALAGVRLDALWNPVRSIAGPIDAELMPSIAPGGALLLWSPIAVLGQRTVVMAEPAPGSGDSPIVSWFDVRAGAVASQLTHQVAVVDGRGARATLHAAWPDRVLLVHVSGSSSPTTQVLWLNAGL